MAFDFEHEDKSVEALLKKTPYHSLKDKLIELGVEDAWKGGKKKELIIKEAVEKLAKIKSEIDKGLTKEEAIEKLPLLEATEQQVIEAQVIEADAEKVIEVQEAVSELELQHTIDGVLNVEAIEFTIAGAEKGLKRATFSQLRVTRQMYLDKIDALHIVLEKAIKLVFSANGNVGSYTDPKEKLHIKGNK